MQPQPVPVLALAAVRAQVNAGQGPDGAAETDHDLAAAGGGHDIQHLRANAVPERPELARRRRVVAQESPRGPHGTERKAGDGEHLRSEEHTSELQSPMY